jgi:hypothetical protein
MMINRQPSKRILSIILGLFAGIVCMLVAVVVLVSLKNTQPRTGYLQPVVTKIVANPILVSATLTSMPIEEPTLPANTSATPTDPGNAIQVGINVRVSGTGGDGLRVRNNPGIGGNPLFLAAENEVMVVKDGPQSNDGITWWLIGAPYDESRQGWAAANYLVPLQDQ